MYKSKLGETLKNKVFLYITFIILILQNNLYAEKSNLLNQVNKELDRQQRDDLKKDNLHMFKPKTTLELPSIEESKKIEVNNSCIYIKQTILNINLKILPPNDLYERLENKCVNINDIQLLLSDINKFYQKEGLITTRAYVPQQNIKSGILQITIIAGVLSDYKYSDGSKIDNRIKSAFPINIGEVINLRDLEQGVDNFNLPSSQQGKIELVPAQNQGESFVVMQQNNNKPWKINLTTDNSGYESTGKYKGYVGITYDNLINFNDTLNLSFNQNIDDDKNKKRTKSENIYYTIPYENWLFSYAYYHHKYHRIIQGINEQYYVDGYSNVNSFEINRLLYRDQTARVKLFTNLSLKESRNYIEDFEIETQRRDLTILDIGISGDDSISNATIYYTFGTKFGLNIFGAMDDIPGVAVSKSKTYHTKFSSQLPLFENKFYFYTTLGAQYSPHELAGSEQFGVGGRYDVRGFHEDSLYGNSGAYLRNEIETALQNYNFFKIKYFIGLDAGMVKDSKTMTWSSNEIVGASIGTRFAITDYLNADLTFSKALERPDEFEASKNQIYFNINIEF